MTNRKIEDISIDDFAGGIVVRLSSPTLIKTPAMADTCNGGKKYFFKKSKNTWWLKRKDYLCKRVSFQVLTVKNKYSTEMSLCYFFRFCGNFCGFYFKSIKAGFINFSKLIALKMPVVWAALAALHWQKLRFCTAAAAEAAATKVRLFN